MINALAAYRKLIQHYRIPNAEVQHLHALVFLFIAGLGRQEDIDIDYRKSREWGHGGSITKQRGSDSATTELPHEYLQVIEDS